MDLGPLNVLPEIHPVIPISVLESYTCSFFFVSRFLCLTCGKSVAKVLRFAAEKRYVCNVAKPGDGRTNLRSASWKGDGLGYLWDKDEAGAWRKVIGGKKKVK